MKSYIFSKCPINPIFSTKTTIFVNRFKSALCQGHGLSVLTVASCTCRVKEPNELGEVLKGWGGTPLLIYEFLNIWILCMLCEYA